MHTRISLDGSDWLLKDFIGEDWLWRSSHKPDTRDMRGWRPATVPGSIANDLLVNSEIPDPYYDRNSLLIEWIPDRTWLYKHTFEVDKSYRGKRCQLRFEGVDYEAQFFLNGECIGAHRSMYTPAVFEVGSLLKFGEPNLIAVIIERAPDEQPQIGKTSAVRTHKSRMTYWWDFCPRMIHIGIWESAALVFTDAVRIDDVYVHPQLNADLNRAAITVTTALDTSDKVTVELETSLYDGDRLIEQKRLSHALNPGATSLETMFDLAEPRLWWPNGYGDQPLYTAQVRVLTKKKNVSDARDVTFGIRHIEFVANESAPADARPYTLVVNGQKMFINGWNWVPLDVMYGVERPAKLERLLTLAQRANVNLLRVWGGGLIEREAFYNLCDQLGILVWQEFILSSSGIDNRPSDDPAYIDLLTHEAETIIPRKRNHPSLAIWCGGNELQGGPEQPIDESASPALAALKAVVARLDPGRYWLPTSSSGPRFSFQMEKANPPPAHDVHGPWEYQGLTKQYALYNTETCLLHSEFGTEGLTNLNTLTRTIPEAKRWPVTLDNPVWQHRAAWWVKEKTWQEALGDVPDLQLLVRGTQYLQAEGVRYAIEAHRRAMYHTSGAMPWQFDEPFPMAACTSAVDYYTQPKPLYYAVARAYEPLHLSAKFASQVWPTQRVFKAELWITHAHNQPLQNAELSARLIGSRGHVYGQHVATIPIPANASHLIDTFSVPLKGVEDIFFLDLSLTADGKTLAQNRYSFTRSKNLEALLSAAPTTLQLARSDSSSADSEIIVSNTGAQAALWVWLDSDAPDTSDRLVALFSDNYFPLLPGESRTIKVIECERVRAQAWNSDPVEIWLKP